ncbi:hypothetical protein F5883DRAFT_722524 [Diaporthe sp. PMI_573]|nr:hypothetical protein F5883DRAFT_722524 [Diaporthaceae sp. PMI_573]
MLPLHLRVLTPPLQEWIQAAAKDQSAEDIDDDIIASKVGHQRKASSKFGRRMASAPHDDADGDAEMIVDDGRNGIPTAADGFAHGSPACNLPRRGSFDFEAAPVDLVELELRQLKEDRDGLHYDVEWTGHQVGLANITPAESRTYQLRLLDLRHQLRQTNHRIHMREAENHNYRFGLAPIATNQQLYARNFAQRAFFINPQTTQERRRPGRPLGSKNRLRGSLKPFATAGPQAPTKNAQKAAAPASAGAKRILPDEITVATPNNERIESAPLAKRPRVEVGSPVGSPAEDNSRMVVNAGTGNAACTGDNTSDDTVAENGQSPEATLKVNKRATSVIAVRIPSSPSVPSIDAKPSSAQAKAQSTPPAARTTPRGTVDETGPGGSTYQRLGHWMCTLCTSQKYLQAPPPKQPSEPSTWPLRDVSKIVTHYTRMHGEHNRMERCMELGTALQANLGPFRYWIQETKREKIPLEEVRETLATLHRGELPDLLRRHSAAASAFPR